MELALSKVSWASRYLNSKERIELCLNRLYLLAVLCNPTNRYHSGAGASRSLSNDMEPAFTARNSLAMALDPNLLVTFLLRSFQQPLFLFILFVLALIVPFLSLRLALLSNSLTWPYLILQLLTPSFEHRNKNKHIVFSLCTPVSWTLLYCI